jgi:ABC-2 type transport system permease protein
MGAKDLLTDSFRIAWKDLKDLFRNRLGMVLLVLMPLFMMVLVGLIYPSSGTVTNLQVGLVNNDSGFHNSKLVSQTFITELQQINSQTHIMKLSNVTSVADIRDMIKKGELEGGIIIPSNFSESIMTGQQGTLIIVNDESDPQISAALQGELDAVIDNMGTALAQQRVQPLNATNSLAVVQPYNVQTQGVVPGNARANYFSFVAPGIMALTVTFSVMTGLPGAISQERELGTMDGMMVAPINRFSIIFGKSLGQTARGMIQGTITLLLAVLLFGVTIQGSIVLVYLLLIIGVFAFVGLGVLITSVAKDQQTAQMLLMTIVFPMAFLSGVFFPIQQMPWYMQDVSKVLPLTYEAQALRGVMVLGAGIPDITTELIFLIIFGTIMMAIAVPMFKRLMTR